MKKQGILSVLLSVILFLQIITINTAINNTEVMAEDSSDRMNGVWVATVANLDYPVKATTSSESLKAEADEIISNCRDLGFNAIFLQVRPASDAIYKSSIFPWSQYLTGSQGTAPDNDFDPLEYWVSKCHENNIELHAWINPYRATRNSNGLDSLANSNPAKQHPEYMVRYSDGNYYYNPALPEVRQLLVDGVMEIVNNYNVDGIHMDDYFYPGQNFDDDEAYAEYGNGQDIGDWRRENVNTLIKEINTNVKASGKDIDFGISPSGIWANKSNSSLGSDTRGSESYYNLYADTRKWALEGWIDYICPQVYWEIGHSTADYETLAYWWANTLADCDTKLYIGLADYKCDGVDSSSVWYNGKAIQQQLALNNSIPKISGEVHFRYQLIVDNPSLCSIIKNKDNNSSADTVQADTQAETEAVVETTTAEIVSEEVVSEAFDVNSIVNNDPDKILVYVNGNKVEFDQEPVIRNSRTLVPFRKIFEALGAEVVWYEDTQQVIGKLNDTEVSLVIGEKIMLVNKTDTVMLDTPPVIISSRTMVPLRAISEALGMEVNWNNSNRVITINS